MGMRQFAVFLCVSACAVAGEEEGNPDGGTGRADASPRIDSSISPDAAAASACAGTLAELSFDWELGAQGFTHAPLPEVDPPPVTWTYDHWQLGSPTATGPTSCSSGSQCFGTNLQGNYIFCQRAFLESPTIDLSACGDASDTAKLVFDHYFDFWTANYGGSDRFDGGLVEISRDGGLTWESAAITYPGTIRINSVMGLYECVEGETFYVDERPGFVGASAGWQTVSVDLPQTMRTTTFKLRFVYASGVAGQTSDEAASMTFTRPGWYIDDIRFSP